MKVTSLQLKMMLNDAISDFKRIALESDSNSQMLAEQYTAQYIRLLCIIAVSKKMYPIFKSSAFVLDCQVCIVGAIDNGTYLHYSSNPSQDNSCFNAFDLLRVESIEVDDDEVFDEYFATYSQEDSAEIKDIILGNGLNFQAHFKVFPNLAPFRNVHELCTSFDKCVVKSTKDITVQLAQEFVSALSAANINLIQY